VTGGAEDFVFRIKKGSFSFKLLVGLLVRSHSRLRLMGESGNEKQWGKRGIIVDAQVMSYC
jgi:hypothetical protein